MIDMNFIVPGWAQFLAEPEHIHAEVVMDRGLEHEEEAWRLGNYIPSVYTENGKNHIVCFGGDLLPEKLSLKKIDDRWVVEPSGLF